MKQKRGRILGKSILLKHGTLKEIKMKTSNSVKLEIDDITRYAKAQISSHAEICTALRKEIDSILPKASSRIYYSMPVWFIDDNPVVGYKVKPKYVNLLFWNGQALHEKKLLAAGKFKAAQIKFTKVTEIDITSLRRWLRKAKTDIWNYQDMRDKNC
jgi:hypothetical protein